MAEQKKERRTPRKPTFKVSFQLTAASAPSVVKKLKDAGLADVEAQVTKVQRAESRADRLAEAESMVQDALGVVQELQGEMEEWHSNMPENLQSSDKGERVDAAANSLQEIADALESVDFNSVEFPGMMG